MKNREVRIGVPIEIRSDDDDGLRVTGYAAVFGERADIGGFFTEEIAPGAFADSIKRDDVVFLVNHTGLPLARTGSGTLNLSEDKRGLKMDTDLDSEDPDAKSITGKMKRGDLDKMSFAFIAEKQEWDDTGEVPHRTIQQASLIDVSIVTFPAYDATEIGLRSLNDFRASQKTTNFNAANRRVREKMAERALSKLKPHLAE